MTLFNPDLFSGTQFYPELFSGLSSSQSCFQDSLLARAVQEKIFNLDRKESRMSRLSISLIERFEWQSEEVPTGTKVYYVCTVRSLGRYR